MSTCFDFNWIREANLDNENLVVFDIGAHDFTDSIKFKEQFPQAAVHAFEADPYNFLKYGGRALQAGIIINHIAVMNFDGVARFYNSESFHGHEWTMSGSLMRPKVKEGTREELRNPTLMYNMDGQLIMATRLDTYCAKHSVIPNVLHVDVQGAEQHVLSSLGEIRPKLVFAETIEFDTYETNTTLESFNSLMLGFGYQIQRRLQDDTLYAYQ